MVEDKEEAAETSRSNGHSIGMEGARAGWKWQRTQLQDADRWVRERARARPLVALAAVIVAGYCVGRLVARL